MSAPLCLDDYDAIGFDLDNTLAVYNLRNLFQLEYECLAQYLVKFKKYDAKFLLKPIDNADDLDFIQRGLIADAKRGNLLKLASDGTIMKVAHGKKFLSSEDIKHNYGPDLKWEVTNVFIKDFLATWNGELSEQMRSCLDFFDTPSSLVFARAVESLDEANEGKSLENYHVYKDILEGLEYMFTPSQFSRNEGMFFPALKANPERFYRKTPEHVFEWLKELRSKRKILFLLTGSNTDYAQFTARTCLGEGWEQYFDFVGYFAKKVGFFNGANRPFLKTEKWNAHVEIPSSELKVGDKFCQGNWDGLMFAIKNTLNKTNIKPVYIGDNFIEDIYTPSKFTHCDTIAVAEEQAAESFQNPKLSHLDTACLKSNVWDSYFYFQQANEKHPTIWGDILKKYCKMCVPSISYLAENPIHTQYTTFDENSSHFNTDGFHPSEQTRESFSVR